MEDSKIVDLYFERSEDAIKETSKKYGKYLYSIAYSVLSDKMDAEESVSDTYYEAWKIIPPNCPQVLKTFLGKLTRRISLDIYRRRTADKRGGGEISLVIDELDECIPSAVSVDRELDSRLIKDAIDSFLGELGDNERKIFVLRYWYGKSYDEICDITGIGASKITAMLYRCRIKLRTKLEKELLL